MEARATLLLKVQALESEHSEFESKLGQFLTKVTASNLLPLTASLFFFCKIEVIMLSISLNELFCVKHMEEYLHMVN